MNDKIKSKLDEIWDKQQYRNPDSDDTVKSLLAALRMALEERQGDDVIEIDEEGRVSTVKERDIEKILGCDK